MAKAQPRTTEPYSSGVDRIQHETQGNVAVTRLTKFISQGAPSR